MVYAYINEQVINEYVKQFNFIGIPVIIYFLFNNSAKMKNKVRLCWTEGARQHGEGAD